MPRQQDKFFDGGSWTPRDGSGAGLVFTFSDCTWVRVGNLVYAFFQITYPATADASVADVDGLPETAKTETDSIGTGTVAFGFCGAGAFCGTVIPNSTKFRIRAASNGAARTNVVMTAAVIRGVAIYECA